MRSSINKTPHETLKTIVPTVLVYPERDGTIECVSGALVTKERKQLRPSPLVIPELNVDPRKTRFIHVTLW